MVNKEVKAAYGNGSNYKGKNGRSKGGRRRNKIREEEERMFTGPALAVKGRPRERRRTT